MKLENQVISLELAQKLKELGVKQESLFYHFDWGGLWKIQREKNVTPECEKRCFSAFTVAELGEMLPRSISGINPNNQRLSTYYLHFWKFESGWYIEYSTSKKMSARDDSHCAHWEEADTEADARAKMLVYLLENNLITP